MENDYKKKDDKRPAQRQDRQPGAEGEMAPEPVIIREDYRGSGHLIDYSATKGAIVAFTRSLAKAVAERGVRVNGVAPDPIWTPLIPASFSPEHVESFGSNTAMGRAGQPAEVGPSYVFLASADASYFTGQVLHPNGGDVMA